MQVLIKRLIYALMSSSGGSGTLLKESARIAPILQRQYTSMMSDWAMFEDRFQKRCGAFFHDFIAFGSNADSRTELLEFIITKRALELELIEEISIETMMRILPLDIVLLYFNLFGIWYYTKISKNKEWIAAFQTYCDQLYNNESQAALTRVSDAMMKKVLNRIHSTI